VERGLRHVRTLAPVSGWLQRMVRPAVLAPNDLPKLCAEQQAYDKTGGEAAQERREMVEAHASGTREMCRITEPQYPEDTLWHANKREKKENAANPPRSSAML